MNMKQIFRPLIGLERRLYIKRKRNKLKNRTASILSSNCTGSIISHDMGCPFNSPTVNLYFLPEDFLKFLERPQYYLDLVPVKAESPEPFPVGRLDDIFLYFMHYKSFEEARDKWIQRSRRVDFDNLFVIMTDKSGCTEEQIRRFDGLPYANKVIFTHKAHSELQSAYYIKGFEEEKEVGILTDWKPTFWKRRWLDEFDYVDFLNRKEETTD